ncbi:MAG: helix-turn-helix transcriptional regulator, partial [Firmicutes bacterium]|nr:helix-turn-helix transcriptional regulator [Bacillota bacterium]
MNIEIANRLVNLRKQKGFSQEELAEKLGLSRQAVSKWERAEASPDTDNLICLAKLYGVSLDELLKTEQTINDIVEEKPLEEKKAEDSGKKKTSVHIGIDGIHVIDDGEEVHIGPTGIHVDDGHDNVHIGPSGIHIGEKKHLKGIKFREA